MQETPAVDAAVAMQLLKVWSAVAHCHVKSLNIFLLVFYVTFERSEEIS